jgi:hypothetical protein
MNDYNDEMTPIEKAKFNKNLMATSAVICTLLGLVIMACFIYNVLEYDSLCNSNDQSSKFVLTNYGLFGDYIGGFVGTLFSLAGFFLIYLTFQSQRENFNRERLENNFFEMIKFHKENVNELQFTYYENSNDKVTGVKRKVFKLIFSQFKELWEELEYVFSIETIDTIYKSEYLIKLNLNQEITTRNIDLKQLAQIDIVFLIVFFGLSKEDQLTLLNLFREKYNSIFTEKILRIASLKPKRENDRWIQWKRMSDIEDEGLKLEVFEDFNNKRNDNFQFNIRTFLYFNEQLATVYYDNNYNKYYGGHQFRLGHYYRNLFQNVNYINNRIDLDYDEKYSYVKLLRVHLSNYEQIMLFLNSISSIGNNWEINQKDVNRHLMTKYNLIKNIPHQNILGTINIKSYYHSIEYENFDSNNNRTELIKKYR